MRQCNYFAVYIIYQRFRERWSICRLPLGALVCDWQKFGVASVILQPTKTVISLAAMSSLQGTISCFITMTPNLLKTNSNHKTDLTITLYFNRKLYAISSTSLAAFFGCNIIGVAPHFTECCYFVVASGENAF